MSETVYEIRVTKSMVETAIDMGLFLLVIVGLFGAPLLTFFVGDYADAAITLGIFLVTLISFSINPYWKKVDE